MSLGDNLPSRPKRAHVVMAHEKTTTMAQTPRRYLLTLDWRPYWREDSAMYTMITLGRWSVLAREKWTHRFMSEIVETLEQILRDADSDLSMVVDVTVFMSDIKRDFTRFNASYGTVFGNCLPSRTTVEVSRFPSEVCIELKVVAMRNNS